MPLHYLILLEQTELLHRFYGKVVVPQVVADELRAVHSPGLVRDWMQRAPSWLNLTSVAPEDIRSIAGELDLGERAAIALAERMRADLLLIDEAAGRTEARRRGLRVTGTLGVLRTAAEEGLLDVPDVLARLERTNFYADEELLRTIFGTWLEKCAAGSRVLIFAKLALQGLTLASKRGRLSLVQLRMKLAGSALFFGSRDGLAKSCGPCSRDAVLALVFDHRRRSWAGVPMSAFLAQAPERLLAVDRLHAAALQIVVSSIERLPQRGQLLQVRSKRVLHEFIRGAPRLRGEIIQLLGQLFSAEVPAVNGLLTTTYSPPSPGALESTARQTLQLDSATARGFEVGADYLRTRRFGVRALVSYSRAALSGENGPYAVTLRYTSMQPPDYVPR